MRLNYLKIRDIEDDNFLKSKLDKIDFKISDYVNYYRRENKYNLDTLITIFDKEDNFYDITLVNLKYKAREDLDINMELTNDSKAISINIIGFQEFKYVDYALERGKVISKRRANNQELYFSTSKEGLLSSLNNYSLSIEAILGLDTWDIIGKILPKFITVDVLNNYFKKFYTNFLNVDDKTIYNVVERNIGNPLYILALIHSTGIENYTKDGIPPKNIKSFKILWNYFEKEQEDILSRLGENSYNGGAIVNILKFILKNDDFNITIDILNKFKEYWILDNKPVSYSNIKRGKIQTYIKYNKGKLNIEDLNCYIEKESIGRALNLFPFLESMNKVLSMLSNDKSITYTNNLIKSLIANNNIGASVTRLIVTDYIEIRKTVLNYYKEDPGMAKELRKKFPEFPQNYAVKLQQLKGYRNDIDNLIVDLGIKEVADSLSGLKEIQNSKYSIVLPTSILYLQAEGRALNHCIGGYGNYINDKKSIIIFIRLKEDLTKPLYTAEFLPRYRYDLNHIQGIDGSIKIQNHPDLLEYVRDIETYLKNWGSKA